MPEDVPSEPASTEVYRDLTKQLLTLASGILALTITFLEKVLTEVSGWGQVLLATSWGLYIVSILAGIGALMGIAGTLYCRENPDDETRCQSSGEPLPTTIYAGTVRWPGRIQVLGFLIATACLIGVGLIDVNLTERDTDNESPQTTSATLTDSSRSTTRHQPSALASPDRRTPTSSTLERLDSSSS